MYEGQMTTKSTKQPSPMIAYVHGAMARDKSCGAFVVHILQKGKAIHEITQVIQATSQRRIELEAICIAIEQVPANGEITIHSRSYFVFARMTEMYPIWKEKNWKAQVANKDLWRRIDTVLTKKTPKVTWMWDFNRIEREEQGNIVKREAENLVIKSSAEIKAALIAQNAAMVS